MNYFYCLIFTLKAKAKEAKIAAKQLQEEEMRVLFNEGIANQFGKKKSEAQAAAKQMGISEASKDVAKLLEEFSSDEDSDDDEFDTHRRRNKDTVYIDDDEPVAIEVFRERTIEDIIEEQREKLASEGKVGTPVTAETFAVWRAGKLAARQADAEARMRAEQMKKKGGKGLCTLLFFPLLCWHLETYPCNRYHPSFAPSHRLSPYYIIAFLTS